jgi:hypothetical protein
VLRLQMNMLAFNNHHEPARLLTLFIIGLVHRRGAKMISAPAKVGTGNVLAQGFSSAPTVFSRTAAALSAPCSDELWSLMTGPTENESLDLLMW